MADPDRRYFGTNEAKDIFEACSGKCFYCYKTLTWANFQKGTRGAWHVDHLIPVARRGATSPKNGVAACFDCNSKKGDLTHVQFMKKVGEKVRCHGFTQNRKRCSNSAQKGERQSLYCWQHTS